MVQLSTQGSYTPTPSPVMCHLAYHENQTRSILLFTKKKATTLICQIMRVIYLLRINLTWKADFIKENFHKFRKVLVSVEMSRLS